MAVSAGDRRSNSKRSEDPDRPRLGNLDMPLSPLRGAADLMANATAADPQKQAFLCTMVLGFCVEICIFLEEKKLCAQKRLFLRVGGSGVSH